jgi:hypothetical protein
MEEDLRKINSGKGPRPVPLLAFNLLRVELIKIIFSNPFSTSQEILWVSSGKTNRLILHREVIVVYSEEKA